MNRYILEFIAICDFLKKSGVKRKNGYMLVNRPELELMLDRNKYETAKNKLKVWKQLNWIATDEDRLTKRIHMAGQYISMIFIDEKVYQEMKIIRSKEKEQRK